MPEEPTISNAAEGTQIERPLEASHEDRRVEELISTGAEAPELAVAVEAQEAADAADTLERLPEHEAIEVLGEMEFEAAAEALAHMVPALAAGVVEELAEDRPKIAARLLEEMAPDDATDLLQELAATPRERVLAAMSAETLRRLRDLLRFPEDTAGGLMTTDYLAVRAEMTVAEAVEAIRRVEIHDDTTDAYVVDRRGHLEGTVSLRTLLLARPDERIGDLADRRVDAVPPELDREAVARSFERYDHLVLPVVDEKRRLLGIVTVDDVIDTIRAETTEDAQLMVGAGREEAVTSTMVVLQFEGLIAELAVLAVLMPLVANQAGNAGQQSLAVTLRGLVLDEVPHRGGFALLLREGGVGLVNGVCCGVLVGGAIAAIELLSGGGSAWRLGVVVAIAMSVALAVGCLAGAGIPILMRRAGADPATASTIFLTMVTDSLSFLSFLGLASALSGWIEVPPA
ncbi:MAG: magnesium transporter [Planctomycetota bacterium]|jgi:magnesium transporter